MTEQIEGRNPVLEALRAQREIDKIMVTKGERQGSVREIIALAREQRVIVQEVDRRKLDEIAQTGAHQGGNCLGSSAPVCCIGRHCGRRKGER